MNYTYKNQTTKAILSNDEKNLVNNSLFLLRKTYLKQ